MNAPIQTPIRPGQNKPPRKPRQEKLATFIVNFIAISVLLALVLGLGLWLANTIVGKQQLTQTGIQISATITKHHSEIVRGSRSSSENFLVDYTFTPFNRAEELYTDVELPVDLWNTVDVGSTISVTYKASYPADNQPTMMLRRLLPDLTGIIQLLAGVLVVAIFIWLAITLVRVIASRRRKSKAADPRAGAAEVRTPKKRSSKHAAPKAQLPEKLRELLGITAVILGLMVIFGVFSTVFVLGIEFVGALVIDAIQNFLL